MRELAYADATLVTVDGVAPWMLDAIDRRARDSVDDLLASGALARSLDRPRSRPYRLRPRHLCQVDVAGTAAQP